MNQDVTPKDRSVEDLLEIAKIADKAAASFRGQFPELESAVGMLLLGRRFGWKVLHLVHSKATIRKYEGILGVKIREIFPEVGADADRSIGFSLAKRFTSFWKIVNGEEPAYKKSTEIR